MKKNLRPAPTDGYVAGVWSPNRLKNPKPKMLVLTPSALEGIPDGTKIRAQGAVAALQDQWEIEVLPFQSASPGKSWGRLRRLFTTMPALVQRFYCPRFATQVIDRARSCDLCYFVGLQMAQYAFCLPRTTPVVLDNYNVEHEILLTLARRRPWTTRWFWYLEALKLWRFEQRALRRVDLCVAISSLDAASFERMHPGSRLAIVPPALDLDPFLNLVPEVIPGRIVFIGVLDWHVNQDAVTWMAQEVMPRVWQRHPEASLDIVGRNPSTAVLALERPGIQIHPNVHSVLPYLSRAHVVVAPLQYGSGVQTKVIEAMAAAKAVVVTPVSAAGIQAKPEVHFVLGAGAEEFSQQCVRLLENTELVQRLAAAGRKRAQEVYSHASVAHEWRAHLEAWKPGRTRD